MSGTPQYAPLDAAGVRARQSVINARQTQLNALRAEASLPTPGQNGGYR